MIIYVSGIHSGPNPSPGVGIARSLRAAYPGSKLIGVDYSKRSTGIHWPDFDDIWLNRPWDQLDMDDYGLQIRGILDSGAMWLSGLDLETLWLATFLRGHSNLLVPPLEALRKIAKPAVVGHEGLPVRIPASIHTSSSDWDLHAFCRKYGWRMWLKGPYYEARRVTNWRDFNQARVELTKTWSTDGLFLQPHVSGYEESIAFCAHHGELLGSLYMSKRDLTPEGKAWAGHITDVPSQILMPLGEIVGKLDWTGGAEIEFIRDLEGQLWLLEWNPRFPAWIHGGTIAGRNLPGLLIAHCSGIPASTPRETCDEFVRVVLEIPVRPKFPLRRPPEPEAGSFGTSLKHPSGMPLLAERLDKLDLPLAKSPIPIASDSAIPSSIVIDLASDDVQGMPTPSRLFLATTAATAFRTAAELANRISTSSIEVRVAYSIKTNPDDRFLELAKDSGLLVEAISQLEVRKAQSKGFVEDQIVLNGPGKWWPPQEAQSGPLLAVFCDSVEELRNLVLGGRVQGDLARFVGFRIRPPRVGSRFGIAVGSTRVFKELVALIETLPMEVSLGAHFHLASSEMGIGNWWDVYNSVLKWSRALEAASGRRVECLDLGGGWFPADWDAELRNGLPEAVHRAQRMLPGLRLIVLEPGRALVQSSLSLVVRVLEVRRVDGCIEEVIVDGSIAELPEVNRYPHRILLFDSVGRQWKQLKKGKARIMGRLCMEDDIISANLGVPPDLGPGDILVIADAGGYDVSMSYAFGTGEAFDRTPTLNSRNSITGFGDSGSRQYVAPGGGRDSLGTSISRRSDRRL